MTSKTDVPQGQNTSESQQQQHEEDAQSPVVGGKRINSKYERELRALFEKATRHMAEAFAVEAQKSFNRRMVMGMPGAQELMVRAMLIGFMAAQQASLASYLERFQAGSRETNKKADASPHQSTGQERTERTP